MNESIENKVRETMESLDNLERAQARPFMYSRIRHRMSSDPDPIFSPLRLVQVAAIMLVLLINGYVVYSNFSNTPDSMDEMEYLVEEYSTSSSIYDITEE